MLRQVPGNSGRSLRPVHRQDVQGLRRGFCRTSRHFSASVLWDVEAQFCAASLTGMDKHSRQVICPHHHHHHHPSLPSSLPHHHLRSHFGSRAISVRTGIATVSLRVQSFRLCLVMSRGNGFGDGWPPSAGRLVCLFLARVLLSTVVTLLEPSLVVCLSLVSIPML